MKINKKEVRHGLTKLLKLDMYELKSATRPEEVDFYAARMYGIVAAYREMEIINSRTRVRYINIIGNAMINGQKLLNERRRKGIDHE